MAVSAVDGEVAAEVEDEIEGKPTPGEPTAAEGLSEDVEKALSPGKAAGSAKVGSDDFDFYAYQKKVREVYSARKKYYKDFFASKSYLNGKTPLRVDTLIDLFAMRGEMDQNINVFVWGDKGLGKSSLCFTMAMIVDPDWEEEMQGRRINTLPDIIQIGYVCAKMIKTGEYTKEDFRHVCIVLDEAGGAGAGGGRNTVIVMELIDYFEMSRVMCLDLIWNAPDAGRFRGLIPLNFHAKIWVSNRNHSRRVIIGWLEIVGMLGTWVDFFNPECIEWDADGICHPRCWKPDGGRPYCRHNRDNMRVKKRGANFTWKCGRIRRGKRIVVPYCPTHVHEKQDGVKFGYMADKFGGGLRHSKVAFKRNRLATYECRNIGFIKKSHENKLGVKFAKEWDWDTYGKPADAEPDGTEETNPLADMIRRLQNMYREPTADGGGTSAEGRDDEPVDPGPPKVPWRKTDYEDLEADGHDDTDADGSI